MKLKAQALLALAIFCLANPGLASEKEQKKTKTLENVVVRGISGGGSGFIGGALSALGGGAGSKGITTFDPVVVKGQRPSEDEDVYWPVQSARNQETQSNCQSGSVLAGNPVVLATGNKVEAEQDFESAGEMGLFLVRTYNRQWSGRGIFGRNWLSNFDYSLTPQTAGGQGILWLQVPDGRRIAFVFSPGKNRWEEAEGRSPAFITRSADGTYTHFNEFNGTERYNADGYILERRNEQGVSWTFTYSNKLLQRVVHSSGREVNFIWTGREVTTVVAPTGASFTYTYTPNVFGAGHGRLASATRPATPGGPRTTTMKTDAFPMR